VKKLNWIIKRTCAVLRREGALGTAQRIVKHARILIGLPSGPAADYERVREQDARAFDQDLALDTGGTIYLCDLTIDSPNAALGVSYIASRPHQFRNAMGQLDIDLEGATFVDLGSGKGRVLMMAAEYPFVQIIGVEFAAELHETCRKNLEKFGDARLSSQLADAAAFAFPPTDLVVFMNNPFDRPVVEKVARNLEAFAASNPCAVRVVYTNAAAPDAFAAEPWFHVGSAPGGDVFGIRAAG
jgi:SAM-dependent methyltransferase